MTTRASSAGSTADRTLGSALGAAIVFTTSAAVLVLEILAGRLLAPYVGVTLETFTGIIGVVLAGIALGTWLGGRLADRIDPRRLLPGSLVLGGALAVLAIPLIRGTGAAIDGSGPAVILLLATVGFLAPSTVLSAVTPLVIKIQLTDLAETGQVVGRLSALGTAGSLVGVFMTGFVLIAAFPTTPVVVIVGGTLMLSGIGLHLHLRQIARRGGFVMGGLALAVASSTLAIAMPDRCEVETAYFCATIRVDPHHPSGRILILDTLQHSYVDLDDPEYLGFAYVRVLGDLIDERPSGPVEVIHLGGGGFTLPRYVRATRPGSGNLVLELDRRLVSLAEERLGLVLGDGLAVRTGDARAHLRTLSDDSADVIIGDAFGGLAVPWHLTTREFTSEVRRVLRPDGIYAINVIDFPPMGFARAEVATIDAVFEHVALIAPAARLRVEQGGNLVVIASDRPLPVEALRARFHRRDAREAVLSEPSELEGFIGDARVLTDDHAPVDQLLTTAR